MKAIKISAFLLLLVSLTFAQEKTVPVGDEPDHHLVLENEYTRVFHVVLPPGNSTLMHQHVRDYVYVMIGPSQIEMTKAGAAPMQMKLNDGDVKFTKSPLTHKVSNIGETPFVNVTIEVKKPSTKAVCGASWAGQTSPPCGSGGGGSAGVQKFSNIRNLETDAVAADTVIATGKYEVETQNGHPSLLVAITPLTANELKTNNSMKATVMEGKKLDAGNVFWIPENDKINVVSPQGAEAKFVLVEFR